MTGNQKNNDKTTCHWAEVEELKFSYSVSNFVWVLKGRVNRINFVNHLNFEGQDKKDSLDLNGYNKK